MILCLLQYFIPVYDIIGQSGDDRRYLTAAAIILYLYLLLGLGIELEQMILMGYQYWLEFDNYFQLSTYLLTIIFVSGFGNDCWCAPSWQWQIGAFSVFLAWFNFIFILKDMPCTAIPIHMFISICITFLKLIYLPLLLVLSFAIPFYTVFVRTASSYKVSYKYIICYSWLLRPTMFGGLMHSLLHYTCSLLVLWVLNNFVLPIVLLYMLI